MCVKFAGKWEYINKWYTGAEVPAVQAKRDVKEKEEKAKKKKEKKEKKKKVELWTPKGDVLEKYIFIFYFASVETRRKHTF